MNYGELKAAILSDAHRTGHTAVETEVPRFVRQCEGMLRRDLTAYLLSTTMSDADRISGAVYDLPVRALVIRSIHLQGRQGESLDRVIPGAIRRLSDTADVLQYAEYGDGRIEFRGNPSTAHVFDISYYGTPAPFVDDADENELLTDHEGLYIAGGLFHLYLHTEDRELAGDQLDIFTSILDTLNEQIARKIGGASIAPTYNMAGGSAY